MIELLFKLLIGHAFADFAFQPDAMAKGKNPNNRPDPSKIPPGQKYCACWPYWLGSHCLIHGAFVYWATGYVFLGILETVLHWFIDRAKGLNLTNPHQDQLLHLLCKILYLIILL